MVQTTIYNCLKNVSLSAFSASSVTPRSGLAGWGLVITWLPCLVGNSSITTIIITLSRHTHRCRQKHISIYHQFTMIIISGSKSSSAEAVHDSCHRLSVIRVATRADKYYAYLGLNFQALTCLTVFLSENVRGIKVPDSVSLCQWESTSGRIKEKLSTVQKREQLRNDWRTMRKNLE